MKIIISRDKEVDVNEQKVVTEFYVFLSKLIEREKTVLKDEYINWLAEFVRREKEFDDEANRVGYSDSYTEEEKEKIYLISTLFLIVSNYYDKHGI